MNKMMVSVFDTESAAFEGLNALKDLHYDGDISLYGTAVLVKDGEGRVSVKQADDEGPVGTAIGMMSGALVGMLAGPAGMAVGASLGGLTGMIVDLDEAGVDVDFVNEVGDAMTPGKSAVVADVQEGWTTPVDSRIQKAGGLVYRRLRSEVVEDQMAREAAAFDAELQALNDEMAQAKADAKAAIKKDIDAVKEKLKTTHEQVNAKIEKSKHEAEAKIEALKLQLKEASDAKKAKIEKRIAEVKEDLASRTAKLKQAGHIAKEALAA